MTDHPDSQIYGYKRSPHFNNIQTVFIDEQKLIFYLYIPYDISGHNGSCLVCK